MSLLDVIVLTNTKNLHYQNLTTECINSYLSSGEKFINRILLMETNKDWDSSYWNSLSPKVNCVVPGIPFNYNRFLNKALELCTSSIICISNNDVFPQKECVPNIIKAFEENPDLMSASPIDRTWHRNSYADFPSDDTIYEGWETTKYVLGFNIYTRAEVYQKIGLYDERFDFYYQDNDYEMRLRALNLKHGLVSSAQIAHGKGSFVTEEQDFDVNAKLKSDREKFIKKWHNVRNKDFKPYLKLGILSKDQFSFTNKYIKISTNINDISHCQYIFDCTMPLTDSLIKSILNKIDTENPDKIVVNEQNTIIRNF